MFEVKVEGVQVVNESGKERRFGRTHRPHAGLEEGLRAAWQPVRASTTKPSAKTLSANDAPMALIKYKPSSPGTRCRCVKIDSSHLHKGGP